MERDGMFETYDIEPTPVPLYTSPLRTSIDRDVTTIRYGGWTNNTYLHVLRSDSHVAKIAITFTTLAELGGVVYNIHSQLAKSTIGMLPEVPQ